MHLLSQFPCKAAIDCLSTSLSSQWLSRQLLATSPVAMLLSLVCFLSLFKVWRDSPAGNRSRDFLASGKRATWWLVAGLKKQHQWANFSGKAAAEVVLFGVWASWVCFHAVAVMTGPAAFYGVVYVSIFLAMYINWYTCLFLTAVTVTYCQILQLATKLSCQLMGTLQSHDSAVIYSCDF